MKGGSVMENINLADIYNIVIGIQNGMTEMKSEDGYGEAFDYN